MYTTNTCPFCGATNTVAFGASAFECIACTRTVTPSHQMTTHVCVACGKHNNVSQQIGFRCVRCEAVNWID